MFKAIIYNLKHLLDFKGRDGRATFWYYFLFIAVLNILALITATIPAIMEIIGEIVASGTSTADPAALEAAALERMMAIGLPAKLVKLGLAVAAANIVLMSASFVRRAHDSGLPGLLLVIPLSLQGIWMYFSFSQLDGLDATMRVAIEARQAHEQAAVQVGMIAQDLIGWLVIVIVAVIGFVKTQQSANQYGEAPVNL